MDTNEVTRITAEEVRERLGRGEELTLVDARSPDAWSKSDETIAGSIRVPADDARRRAGELPRDRTVVAWCT